MPRIAPYDASAKSLFFPHTRSALLQPGGTYNEAQIAAECARLVYVPFDKDPVAGTQLRSTLTSLGFIDIEFYSNTALDAQAMVLAYPALNLLILSIRGTEVNLKDYKTDFFEWKLKPWAGSGQVHHGFAEALDALWTQISTWFAVRSGTRIFTGHSMGAAMATLAAGRLPPQRVYTFGSPRVGDTTFTSSLSGIDIRRYVDCCDVVPTIPLRIMNFSHVGRLYYFDRKGDLHLDTSDSLRDSDARWANLSYLFSYAWRPGNVWLRGLADHNPFNYCSAVLGS